MDLACLHFTQTDLHDLGSSVLKTLDKAICKSTAGLAIRGA